jgi:hypothetical protein
MWEADHELYQMTERSATRSRENRQAAKHFRRIALTRGNDIQNVIVALNKMVVVYRVQRWLWICVVTIVAVALATTIVSR